MEENIRIVPPAEDTPLRQMIRAKLEESEAAASDPSAKRYTHDEIFAPLRERYEFQN